MAYWLFKSEPDCFSFADLCSSPGKTTGRDGVRNYQARSFLRDDVQPLEIHPPMSRLEHFAIYAADPSALKDFYCAALGLRVVLDNGAGSPPGYFLADDAGMALEIIGRPADASAVNQRYVCHVAFGVVDFSEARSNLERLGLHFETETAVENAAMRTAFFNDPEGNRCQIVWRSRPLGSAT